MKESKGSVLIISLILMSVATLLSLFIIKVSKDIVSSSQLLMEKLEAKIKAESEIERFKYFASTSWFDRYKIVNINSVKDYPKDILLTGSKVKLSNGNELYITDSSSKINLFIVDESIIGRLLRIVIKDEKKLPVIKDSFLDWIDRDKLIRLYGAEDDYYKNEIGARYTPRNNNFMQSIEELLDIRGIDNDTYEKIKKVFTFSYGSWGTNAYLVSPELLKVIAPDIKEETAETLEYLRKKGKFKRFDQLTGELFKGEGSGIYSTELSKVVNLKVVSKVGNAVEKIYCIIDFKPKDDYPFVVYKYKE